MKDKTSFIKLEADQVFVNENFIECNTSDPNTNTYNDLAIIKLKKPIQVSKNLRPICLGIDTKMNDQVLFQGYGTLNCVKNNKVPKLSNRLMETDLIIDSMDNCEKLYNEKIEMVTDENVCAKNDENGSTDCPGDSGLYNCLPFI